MWPFRPTRRSSPPPPCPYCGRPVTPVALVPLNAEINERENDRERERAETAEWYCGRHSSMRYFISKQPGKPAMVDSGLE